MIDCNVVFNSQDNYQNGAHAHLDDMLFVPLSGLYSVAEDNQHDVPQQLSAGSIYLAPKHQIHCFQSKGGQEHLCYYLDVANLGSKVPERAAMWQKSTYLSALTAVRRQLFIRSRNERSYEAASIDDLIIREVHRILSVISPTNFWSEAAIVENICSFIGSNMAHNLAIAAIADEFGMSTRTLARWFLQHKGVPLGRYIVIARLTKAKDLLCSTHMHISQVQCAAGFDSAAHFAYSFKRLFGVSPSEMRDGIKLA